MSARVVITIADGTVTIEQHDPPKRSPIAWVAHAPTAIRCRGGCDLCIPAGGSHYDVNDLGPTCRACYARLTRP